jgi:hypothetical protein
MYAVRASVYGVVKKIAARDDSRKKEKENRKNTMKTVI